MPGRRQRAEVARRPHSSTHTPRSSTVSTGPPLSLQFVNASDASSSPLFRIIFPTAIMSGPLAQYWTRCRLGRSWIPGRCMAAEPIATDRRRARASHAGRQRASGYALVLRRRRETRRARTIAAIPRRHRRRRQREQRRRDAALPAPRRRVFRALLTGDAGEAREARLLASGVDLRADVLKVGHHGSQYASTPAFVAAVSPATASISVGRHNTFGHPGASTLATLARAGAKIYRTAKCGALTIDVDQGRVIAMLPCMR
jgi:hypothetical protein